MEDEIQTRLSLGFGRTPRFFGNPMQVWCETPDQLQREIQKHNYNTICYISHNSYTKFKTIQLKGGRERIEPTHMLLQCYFIDLDSDKPENALLDARKLVRWGQENDIMMIPVFSGRKGFHIYIPFIPQEYELNQKLTNYYRSIRAYLVQQLGLRTSDRKCAEPKRLCRIPYTQYITEERKNGKRTGNLIKLPRYCCPLKTEWLLEWTIDEIIEYSEHPEIITIEEPHGSLHLTFEQFLDRFDIQELIFIQEEYGQTKEYKISAFPDVNMAQFIKILIPKKCIHNELLSENPAHGARFDACVLLRNAGYSPERILEIFSRLNWIDFNEEKSMSYIKHIFMHPEYKIHGCGTISMKGYCVGKACEKYIPDIITHQMERKIIGQEEHHGGGTY